MTDITELAQRNELLIANGQQTADLLRHLADNEIDSDYFAVVSECESYGKETDAELSITEFAIRAAGYVDALVEALEKAQQRIDELENDEVRQRLANAEHQLYMAELAKHNLKASRNAQFRKRKATEQRIAELESRTVTVKLPKPHAHLIWIQAGHAPDDYWDDVAVSHSEKDLCCDGSERYPVYARWEIEEMLAAAGIKVEAE
ncbi:TPA: hypothetical protein NEG33_003434 [Klebsiella pneumoniae]|uniref:hypothetical protein n=1 Tax=Klebsiella pneumoniae TaxID=573 RepID=UPI000935E656|nr:hypothetical protein [Klebsiella pneumoniae]HDU4703630.1 hypothetical protein [Klebsiella pneumoniae subsp. pneumoniae]EKW0357948.1 hypothetical protein [Klebsiella pneumoniae]ELA1795460.1 hypothetical protein [Klebsiella pneumoniae]MBK2586055.1 hypothetical protein [Klebsiella pneumoniae]MCK4189124.1 hypothetical protein [Klebsiella pneumoniae]